MPNSAFDEPFFNRYGNWLGDAIMGDLGESIQLREEVADGISRTIAVSLQLMAYSLILAVAISFPLGIYTAYRSGQRQDRAINTVMLGFFAIPPFVLAITLVLFFAIGGIEVGGTDVGFKVLPGARYVPLGEDWYKHFKHMLLPSISLSLGIAAVFMRLLRSDMIGTLRQPFIDLARSKGVIAYSHPVAPCAAAVDVYASHGDGLHDRCTDRRVANHRNHLRFARDRLVHVRRNRFPRFHRGSGWHDGDRNVVHPDSDHGRFFVPRA